MGKNKEQLGYIYTFLHKVKKVNDAVASKVNVVNYGGYIFRYGLAALSGAYIAYGSYHNKGEGLRSMISALALISANAIQRSGAKKDSTALLVNKALYLLIGGLYVTIYSRTFHCFTGNNQNFGILSSLPFPSHVNRFCAYALSSLPVILLNDIIFGEKNIGRKLLPTVLTSIVSTFLSDGILSNTIKACINTICNRGANFSAVDVVSIFAYSSKTALESLALAKVSDFMQGSKYSIPAQVITFIVMDLGSDALIFYGCSKALDYFHPKK